MQFELLVEFIIREWMLVAALAIVLALLFWHESRKAGPAVTPQQAINLANDEQGVFLDIRALKDYERAHITNALNIPYASLDHRMTELDKYKDKPIIIVCRLGQTAGSAAKLLRAKGFERAQKMSGGMIEWESLKLPVVRS